MRNRVTISNSRKIATVAALATAISAAQADGVAAQVTSADEICAPTADPCVISSVIEVENGSTLDFGTRDLLITGAGSLDIGAGTVSVLCGRLEAINLSGNNPTPINARGPSLFGLPGNDGGTVDIQARRACSGSSLVGCLSEIDCDLGVCDRFVCTGDSNRQCTDDAACDAGPCIFSSLTNTSRCLGNRARCETDSDCFLGTCALESPVCSGDLSQSCETDSDCNLGECTLGYGDVTIDGRIRADGVTPGFVTITAVGDVRVSEVALNAADREEDGGFLQIESRSGSIVLRDQINAVGGGQGSGGDITLFSGRDVIVNEQLNIDGGAFDGGFLDVFAGRDAIFADNVEASSVNGDGFGGEVSVFAGRDITITGPAQWRTRGSVDAESFCGEGGPQEFDAGRNLNVDESVEIVAFGPPPDCGGETVSLVAGNDIFLAGDLNSQGRGTDSNGGEITLEAGNVLSVADTALLDVRGGNFGGGDVDITSSTDLFMAGRIDASTSNGGLAGTLTVDAECRLQVSGEILISGTSTGGLINGVVDIDGGDVVFQSGAQVNNVGGFGQNFIRGTEYVTLDAGSSVTADVGSGANTISYRSAVAPPVLNGTVSPAPALVLDGTIPVSPCVCGNGTIEKGESCDDGNRQGGDGCSASCQSEGCVAASPGYPATPLCDDGNDCTVDTCNSQTGTCQHVIDCDDGIACTTDLCVDLMCQHSPNDALCDDGEACTDDVCTVSTGCIGTYNTGVCDDGVGCTVNDTCDRGTCAGTPSCPPGSLCDLELGQCVATVACGNSLVEPPEQCDDGDTEWNPGEPCNATCDLLICGDPDDSGSVNASDALYALRTAVSLETCDVCVCSVDGNQTNSATDALALLRFAVALPVTLVCPPCDP